MNIKNFLMISMVLFMAPNFVFAQDNDELLMLKKLLLLLQKEN